MTPSSVTLPRTVTRNLWMAASVVALTIGTVILWSAKAQIATTLSIPGTVISEQPIFNIQHPLGGRIVRLGVKRLDRVEKGDLIAELDTREAKRTKTATDAQIAMLLGENDAIQQIVEGTSSDGKAKATGPGRAFAADEMARRKQNQMAVLDRLSAEMAGTKAQGVALLAAIDSQHALIALARDRLEKMQDLVRLGARPAAELAPLQEAVLLEQATLAAKSAQKDDAENRVIVLSAEIAATRAAFALELATIRRHNEERLIDLQRRSTELAFQIDQADIRAPTGGTVVDLAYQVTGMVVGIGATVAQIAAPLGPIEIDLQVPPRYIDQVAVGQRGTVTFLGLPQRQMPRIGLEIVAISAAATHDRDGRPTGYVARANVDADDLAKAKLQLQHDLHIARDMPVAVMMEGRDTSPLGYFVQPFLDVARLAFEEG